jgi:hypothetical protein
MSAFLRSAPFLLVLLAAPAVAQDDRPPPPSRPPTLAEQLRLRADQQTAWRAYQDELAQERASAARDAGRAEQLNAMKTPERLDWMLALLPEREAEAKKSAAATLSFYRTLDADQQRAFDRATRAPTLRGGRASQPPASTLRTPPSTDLQPPQLTQPELQRPQAGS